MYKTRPDNHETPTIIPRQSGSILPTHAREQLWSEHTRTEPKGLTDRERLGNVFQRPRGVYEPHCRKVTTKSAQDALNCVLPSPRIREGCAITPSVSRTFAETTIHDTTQDPQADRKYMLFTSFLTLHDVPDQNNVPSELTTQESHHPKML